MTTDLEFDLRGESGRSSEMLLWLAERAERSSQYRALAGLLCLVVAIQVREPIGVSAAAFGLAVAALGGAVLALQDSRRHAREAYAAAEAAEAELAMEFEALDALEGE